ncbi:MULTISPECIES: HIT domain-containing protein [Thermomonas]|jgi:diadenosine tetraphosphate (Ap4A) HIT family hydrolase|uniref:HIT domain-containing protein n=1 Tax=Thermomonas beijingensis TaxID=2872701 RepID=A0ABS7TD84_9GAMM|nr:MULTISPECIES: HIT domain-containing protein [Thermomonas]MBZ4185762.1 HIT domain-containing protein [Thermomonas beijingensis]HOC11028.1 HIT domain-containing protein [Thermomonas sp.]HQA01681.1 HIT domain-containing protein [Thermomonas sp.]HQE07452.1 HIT domain-containing protein [Thermomonas sp.]
MNAWHLHPQLADDSTPVIELALCEVRLMDDANHPWLILIPKVADAVEIIDLSPAQRTQLTAEIDTAARALKALFKPDKLNVAALGNLVPQLHVHVIARYHTDIAWPRPVWGAANACPYAPEQLVDRVRQLRTQLAR